MVVRGGGVWCGMGGGGVMEKKAGESWCGGEVVMGW